MALHSYAWGNDESQSATDEYHSEHGDHHFSVLVGDTFIDSIGEGATIGLDYEVRVSQFVGLGAVVEYAAGDLEAWTALAVADLHITDQFIAQVGPGFERTKEHDLFVARFGLLYEFYIGDFTLSPQLHYDYHDGGQDAIVVGVAWGFSF
jgi:hypothetical protein